MVDLRRISGCYLYWRDPGKQHVPSGVDQKVVSQCRALSAAGIPCELISYRRKEGFLNKALISLPLAHDGNSWPDPHDLAGFDYIYVRRPRYISSDMLDFFSSLKEANPKAKILLEVPTYPYDSEMRGAAMYPALVKDRWNRKKLAEHCDRVVDYSGHDELFGVPALQVINGIDLSRIAPRSESLGDELHIICTAAFSDWHGIDRFLDGLARYEASEPTKCIVFHLVGDGPALQDLKARASKGNLLDHVVFHGMCSRDEMDAVYDQCTLAIECLGIHRKGCKVSSSLKSREYLAKGIPFVYSGSIDIFEEEPADFCLQVPADESPIDIGQIVRFHDVLYSAQSEKAVIERIREYAQRHVAMEKAMKNVIDYIKENC